MLTAGSRLGPYEIVEPIGAGGMGEVFKARDTRLERSVAIKILPALLAQDAQFKLRLEREAKTISQLNHPNICTLFDVGHENGIDYLVMEYIEGESLADRLSRGALPLEQVLRYGMQIAEALDRAHRSGIVHRDLKPGNIMITKSGAKLLDFGLAKPAAGLVASAFSGTVAYTEQKPLTAEGAIVGTLHYMAPEQLEGQPADVRSDIFALGSVLYEMATGRRPFDGKTRTSLIAAIVDRDPPPMSTLQPLTPPAFERLVKVCMAKDPDERWQTAHDVLLQLRWLAEGGSQVGLAAPVTQRRRHRELAAWAIAALLIGSTALFAYLWRREATAPVPRMQLSVLPSPQTSIAFNLAQPAGSPDGTRLVFPAQDAVGGKFHLWQRRLDNGSLQRLPQTEDGYFPFWSPDSRFIGFFSSGKLRKVESMGGPAQVLADASPGRGATWGKDGTILFAADRSAILRIPATGGSPVAVTTLGKNETSHRYPWFLPDGRHFLYLARTSGGGRIFVGDLQSKLQKPLIEENSFAAFSPLGYILYVREGALVARRFDAETLELIGTDPILLANDVHRDERNANAAFSVSAAGILAYQAGAARQQSRLILVDRAGKEISQIGAPNDYSRPSLSNDERKVAVEIVDSLGKSDLWIHDIVRNSVVRLTFDEGRESNAVWSPDDRWIAYAVETTEGKRELRRSLSNGAGSPETLWRTTAGLGVTDWSADGRLILYHATGAQGSLDTGFYSLEQKKATWYVQSRFVDSASRLSPDGRWWAYNTGESGRSEVVVQSFPTPSGKWQVSTQGGAQVRWRADGKELYYLDENNQLMVVDVNASGDSFDPGVPRALFPLRARTFGGWPYDVSGDGQRFVINETVTQEVSEPITVVLNWGEALPR